MKILIVEDEIVIAKNIAAILNSCGCVSEVVHTGEDALFKAETENYDAIILDWMLPDLDGILVCKKLREGKIATPILFLTAKTQLEDKVKGFRFGADDYLTKPFAAEELIARVKAIVRRNVGKSASAVINYADLTLNTDTHEVKRAHTVLDLSPKEYSLLEYLTMNADKALERTDLLFHVWGEDVDPFSNTVDVHIRYLRKKVDDPFKVKLIKTVKGKGYMLCKK